MTQLITTIESPAQAASLIAAGADTLYMGDADFALRVPAALSHEAIREVTALAHAAGRTVTVAVNALMHVDKMAVIRPYLDFLATIGVDQLAVGDAGVIYVLQTEGYRLPYLYDASTMVASARQVNFWASQGAVGAVLARELPKEELAEMAGTLAVPGEILVYGATVIHHSKRPLLQNYFNFVHATGAGTDRASNHFISEPTDDSTHYSIFEDAFGTHIFANDDLDMMTALTELAAMGYDHWKLDGIFTRGEAFVEVVKLFDQARRLVDSQQLTADKAFQLDEALRRHHPAGRTLSRGFYDIDPRKIK